ncbi:tail fiber domain-containing protein [Hymenobacter sp. ASUV-10]|uniref:Tail fiber domain-containing protein n=1 Tax=Hymenobacter aranciens TaxID=3063996 RepID=A0ABT9BFV7_9BACT|nr:tail fiber domain-containing protein [Hymenobacter sp. ASUV-10]MDO7877161.1 tail fiber domain-containing protein [Hymenobacter sp. ASUV-10]
MQLRYPLRRLLPALLLALPLAARAQTPGVGIGTTAPDASAALDIVSSSKGALLPRVAAASSIASPATGLLVFQTNAPAGFYFNAGTPAAPSWQQLATAAGAAVTASNGLTKTGADIALGGTLTQPTTLDQGSNALGLTGAGNLGVGTASPGARLDVVGSLRVGQAGQIAQLVSDGSVGGQTSIGQSFTLPVGATITQVNLYSATSSPTSTTLKIYQGAGLTGTELASQAVTLQAGGPAGLQASPLVLTTPLAVAAGTYTLAVQGGPLALATNGTNPYAGGMQYGTTTGPRPASDLKFAVYYTLGSTPAATLYADGGRVGVGTEAPTATLDVDGATRLRGLSTAGYVTTDAQGNLGSAAAPAIPTSADYVQNQTTTAQPGGFRVSGAGTVGGLLTVGDGAAITGATTINTTGPATTAIGSNSNATNLASSVVTIGTTSYATTTTIGAGLGSTTNIGSGVSSNTTIGGRNTTTIIGNGGTTTIGNEVSSLITIGSSGGSTTIGSGGGFTNIGSGGGFTTIGNSGVTIIGNGNTSATDIGGGGNSAISIGSGAFSNTTISGGNGSNTAIGAGAASGPVIIGRTGGVVKVVTLAPLQQVVTDASGNLSSQPAPALPTGADFVRNQATADQNGSFRLSGTGALGGNLGVGSTAAPAQRLTVVSPDNVASTDIVKVTSLNGASGVSLGYFGLRASGSNPNDRLTLDAKGTGPILLGTDGGTGNVGVGTSSPGQKLDVSGNTNVSGSSYVGGNVGIGTSSPSTRLSISPSTTEAKITLYDTGNATDHYGFGVSGGQLNYHVLSSSDQHVFYAKGRNGSGGGAIELLRIQGNGRVGIGTSSPAQTLDVAGNATVSGRVGIGVASPVAPLHVSGGVSVAASGTKAYFFQGSTGLSGDASTSARAVAAYFTGGQVFVNDYIVAGALNVTSDRRIKRVIGLSDRAADLALLNKVRITDYTYIDQHANTDKVVKKVIAQEVQELLPAAVSQSRQAIPNVYARAARVSFADGVITLVTTRPHELPATGGTLRLYTPQNQELTVAATVLDAHTVRFASAEPHADGLFVYGKYVDDFLSVDYDALTTLNVSATQELARKVEALEQRNATLEARAAASDARATADHAALQTLQQQVARLLDEAPAPAQARR